LSETVEDFWLMVYEQRVSVIAMMTQIIENNRLRCATYWPQTVGDTLTIHNQSAYLKIICDHYLITRDWKEPSWLKFCSVRVLPNVRVRFRFFAVTKSKSSVLVWF